MDPVIDSPRRRSRRPPLRARVARLRQVAIISREAEFRPVRGAYLRADVDALTEIARAQVAAQRDRPYVGPVRSHGRLGAGRRLRIGLLRASSTSTAGVVRAPRGHEDRPSGPRWLVARVDLRLEDIVVIVRCARTTEPAAHGSRPPAGATPPHAVKRSATRPTRRVEGAAPLIPTWSPTYDVSWCDYYRRRGVLQSSGTSLRRSSTHGPSHAGESWTRLVIIDHDLPAT